MLSLSGILYMYVQALLLFSLWHSLCSGILAFFSLAFFMFWNCVFFPWYSLFSGIVGFHSPAFFIFSNCCFLYVNKLILTGSIHQLIHSQNTSRKKESTDIGTEERTKFRQCNWGSNPGPLLLRTSALTTELSPHSRELH